MTPDEADFLAVATLRTFRGKLAHAAETTGAPEQVNLVVDAAPSQGEGTLGGEDVTITPINLWIVNQALVAGGQPRITMAPVDPADWRSRTEIGQSVETVADILPRIEPAIVALVAGGDAPANTPEVT
jgi:hypothetical protein